MKKSGSSFVLEHGNAQLGFDSGANLGITHYNKSENSFMTFQLNEDEVTALRNWLNQLNPTTKDEELPYMESRLSS